jgi:NADH-quinone oxidoreductase subunit H
MNGTAGWTTAWLSVTGLPAGTPEWIVAAVALVCIYSLVVVPSGALISYLERKLSADFPARVGPNRAGPAGALQPLADLLKLLQKDATARRTWRQELWVSVHTMALYSTVAVLPLGSLALLVDTDMSAFLPFWAALVLSLGTMLMGLNQGSIPGWFGGVRVAAHALAGAVPALSAVLAAGTRSGAFRWSAIAAAQGASPHLWTLVSSPFQFIAFVVFVVSGMVILGVPPLDGGVSPADIQGGVASHLSGRRLTLFKFGLFYGLFLWSTIASSLFLGGWSLPASWAAGLREAGNLRLLELLELATLLAKTYLLMLLLVWVARVTPRLRVDQITGLAWRVLSPFALFSLIGAIAWKGWFG